MDLYLSLEIGFFSNKRKNKKDKCRRYNSNLGHFSYKIDTIVSTAVGNLQIFHQYLTKSIVTFIALKVCQSRAIIDMFYQDKGFELTYRICANRTPAFH